MALLNYSDNEALERIYNALIGNNPTDFDGFLGQMPKDEALTRIAQLLEGSLGTELSPLQAIADNFNSQYGGIYSWTGSASSMTAIPTSWTRITGAFQNSMLSNGDVTCQPTQDRILLNDYGRWLVEWQVSYYGSPNIEYMIEPYCWVGMPQAAATSKPAASGTATVMSGVGVANASGTAVQVSLYIKPSATAWFRMMSGQVFVKRLGNVP